MTRRYVPAVVLDSSGSHRELIRGQIVLLDLHSSNGFDQSDTTYSSTLRIKDSKSGNYWGVQRFGIDPLANTRGN